MSVDIIALTNPFTTKTKAVQVEPNGSIADILDSSGISFASGYSYRVFINDLFILPEQYEVIKPVPGDIIIVRAVPAGGGGGGKNTLRLVASIAIIAAAAWVAPMAAGYLFGTYGTTGAMTTAGVLGSPGSFLTGLASTTIQIGLAAGGLYLMNALCPVPNQESRDDSKSIYSIEGNSNKVHAWQPIPVVLGRMRIYPPYAAKPWTEFRAGGEEQWLRLLFCLGYSNLDIESGSYKIGDIELNTFFTATASTNSVETLLHQDFDATTDTLKFFANTVVETQYNVELEHPHEGIGTYQHIFTTTDTHCEEVSVDIVAPSGLYSVDGDGDKHMVVVNLGVSFKRITDENGNPVDEPEANGETGIPITVKNFASQLIHAPRVTGTVYSPNIDWSHTSFVMYYQKTRVWMDELTGEYTVNKVCWENTVAENGKSHPLPEVPAGKIGIFDCRLLSDPRQTGGGSIRDSELTDIRPEEFKASYGDAFKAFKTQVSDIFGTYWVIQVPQGTLYNKPSLAGRSSTPIRRNFTYICPVDEATGLVKKGQYEVHVRRITEEVDDTAKEHTVESVYVTAVRSIEHHQCVYKSGIDLLEIKVAATEKLNGAVDEFNLVATSVCLDWNPESNAWEELPTNNPASLFRLVLQGPMNKKPLRDDQIDLDALVHWHNYCRANNFSYNNYIESQTSVKEVISQICSAGRASPAYKDGKYSIVIDEPKDLIVQHITPRNSWGFSSTKTFTELPQAFRVLFPNAEKLFKSDERLVGDDNPEGTEEQPYYTKDNAHIVEELQLPGITYRDQAWVHGRYHLAQMRLRPEIYAINMDIENLVCTRGDRVKVSHDVTLWGSGFGRLKSVAVPVSGYIYNLTLDEPVTMVGGTDYAIRIRLGDGYSVLAYVVNDPGEQTEITLSPGIPVAEVPLPGDLFLFGTRGEESVDCIVKSIKPSADLTANVELVDYSPAIFNAATGTIPDFDSQISDPVTIYYPTISEVRSDWTVMRRDSDGSMHLRMLVIFSDVATRDLSRISYLDGQIRQIYTEDGTTAYSEWQSLPHTPADAIQVYIDNIERATYQIRFRYVFADGKYGSFSSTPTEETVIGNLYPPLQVFFDHANTTFGAKNIHFVIIPTTDADFDFYEIRTDNDNWGNQSGLIVQTPSTTFDFVPTINNATYYIKAKNREGVYSVLADSITAPAVANTLMGFLTNFSGRDCIISWNPLTTGLASYYIVRVYNNSDYAIGHLVRTTGHLDSAKFTYTYEMNVADNTIPLRDLWFTVTAYDTYGGSYSVNISASNTVPSQVGTPSLEATIGGLDISFALPSDTDIVNFEVEGRVLPANTVVAFDTRVTSNRLIISGLSAANAYRVRIRAYDAFGYGAWSDTSDGTPGSIQVTEYDVDLPWPENIRWTVSNGTLSWDGGSANQAINITFRGSVYVISAGSTTHKYVWWDFGASPNTVFQHSDTLPALNLSIWFMAYFDGVNVFPAESTRLIHGGLVQTGTITATQIAADAITADKLNIGAWQLGSEDSIISEGYVTISHTGVTIHAKNGLQITGGGDIALIGSDTDPGRIGWYTPNGSNPPVKHVDFGIDASGSNLYLLPDVDAAPWYHIGVYQAVQFYKGDDPDPVNNNLRFAGVTIDAVSRTRIQSSRETPTYVSARGYCETYTANDGSYAQARLHAETAQGGFGAVLCQAGPAGGQIHLSGQVIGGPSYNGARILAGQHSCTGDWTISVPFEPSYVKIWRKVDGNPYPLERHVLFDAGKAALEHHDSYTLQSNEITFELNGEGNLSYIHCTGAYASQSGVTYVYLVMG